MTEFFIMTVLHPITQWLRRPTLKEKPPILHRAAEMDLEAWGKHFSGDPLYATEGFGYRRVQSRGNEGAKRSGGYRTPPTTRKF